MNVTESKGKHTYTLMQLHNQTLLLIYFQRAGYGNEDAFEITAELFKVEDCHTIWYIQFPIPVL